MLQASPTKRVLLVDDDPLILRVYGEGLRRLGFQVDTAEDGLVAMRILQSSLPDVVVLDLLMPKFSGLEVLKSLRAQADLAELPVIVLTNVYLDGLAQEATLAGAQKTMLKIRCNPSVMSQAIQEVLDRQAASRAAAALKANPPLPAAQVPAVVPETAAAPIAPAVPQPPPAAAQTSATEVNLRREARQSFLAQAARTCATLRKLAETFLAAQNKAQRDFRLQDLYRQVHFLTTMADLADCHAIAQVATAFEALLFSVSDRPGELAPSARHTLAQTIEFFEFLFEQAGESEPGALPRARVLVVDDDPLSNRLVVAACRQAQLEATSTEDPLQAWQWVNRSSYDLVLLDIGMPGIGGLEFCRRLRALPGYERTPVIYVTSHKDFQSRVEGLLSGGNDVICKPVLPTELAVKALTQLFRSRRPPSA